MIVARVRSVVAYAWIIAYTAIVGPPAMLVTFLTGRVHHLLVLGVFAAKVGRILLGIRLRVDHPERVDGTRPSVYCINHRSHVDAVVQEVMFGRCPQLRVLHKAEMGKLPVLGAAMRMAGFVPVHRADRDRAFEAVDLAAARLGEGYSFLLAPEGTRNPGRGLLPFKKGAFVMAIKAQVPVVPVAILGSDRAMPKGQLHVVPGQVVVRFGEPVPTAGMTLADRDTLSERVRQALLDLLGESQAPGARN